jgi:hypothetical protein
LIREISQLSAFRKGYVCQTALLKVIEDWKKALDQNKYVAAILMDLSQSRDYFFYIMIRVGKRIVIRVVIKITIFYKIENIV